TMPGKSAGPTEHDPDARLPPLTCRIRIRQWCSLTAGVAPGILFQRRAVGLVWPRTACPGASLADFSAFLLSGHWFPFSEVLCSVCTLAVAGSGPRPCWDWFLPSPP